MDQMVLATQVFLNATYGGNSGYNLVTEDGKTGWETIYGLTRALQIELGITNTADNFGPGTRAAFSAQFPAGVQEQTPPGTPSNIHAIIQGALWCKGYSTGASGITQNFFNGTGTAVKEMKFDAGIEIPNSAVTLNVMEALLSMRQFKLVLSGNPVIRSIQRRLNREYESYIGLAPCDGLYGREMSASMIMALQALEGIQDPNGNFGNQTKALLPMLPDTNGALPTQTREGAVSLVHYALICNGYTGASWDSTVWSSDTTSAIEAFQADMCIPVTGLADTNTWMSLFLSKGNPDRAATACDTRFEMTQQNIVTLKSLGYQIVGRYLTGGDFKELRLGEADEIVTKNKLKLFPIFQESEELSKFTWAQGAKDALKAVRAARKNAIPEGAVIFFAVDFDPQDAQITNYIIPYFNAIHSTIDPAYQVGIYGTRNACARVCGAGYAVTSFVSNMSTGYSGNMGFKMPDNWNYDQFAEISVSQTLDIDKDGYSGRFPPVSELESVPYLQPPRPDDANSLADISTLFSVISQLETLYVDFVESVSAGAGQPETPDKMQIATAMTGFLRRRKYASSEWAAVTGRLIDNAFALHVETEEPALAELLDTHITEENENYLTDGIGGVIKLAHFAATLECYLLSPLSLFGASYMAGWGADVASGTKNILAAASTNQVASGDFLQLAYSIIGDDDSECNFGDFCCDADAIKISELIKEQAQNQHPLSLAMELYYEQHASFRFVHFLDDLGCGSQTLSSISNAVRTKMNMSPGVAAFQMAGASNLYNGTVLSEGIMQKLWDAACDAFAYYVYTELGNIIDYLDL